MDDERKKKALIICVDGIRPDALLVADAPHTKRLVQGGSVSLIDDDSKKDKALPCAYSFHARCSGTPVSFPSWSSTLTGVPEELHSVRSNDGAANFCDAPSVLAILQMALADRQGMSYHITEGESDEGLPLKTAAYLEGWYGIRNVLGGEGDTFLCEGDAEDVDQLCLFPDGHDEQATDALCGALDAKKSTDVVADVSVFYLHTADAAGHKHGFAPHIREYTDAIARVDKLVERAWNVVRERRRKYKNEDWLVVMTTDHGGSARTCMPDCMKNRLDACIDAGYGQRACEGVHGLDSVLHKNIFFIVDAADKTIPGEIIPPPMNMDVTGTVLAHFGVNVDGAWCVCALRHVLHCESQGIKFEGV